MYVFDAELLSNAGLHSRASRGKFYGLSKPLGMTVTNVKAKVLRFDKPLLSRREAERNLATAQEILEEIHAEERVELRALALLIRMGAFQMADAQALLDVANQLAADAVNVNNAISGLKNQVGDLETQMNNLKNAGVDASSLDPILASLKTTAATLETAAPTPPTTPPTPPAPAGGAPADAVSGTTPPPETVPADAGTTPASAPAPDAGGGAAPTTP